MLGRGNPRILCEFEPSLLMMSCGRVQAMPRSPVTSGLSVKKPEGLCLRSLQLDLPLQSLVGRQDVGAQKMPGLGMDTRPLGLSRVLRFWSPSPATPFPAPTSVLGTQSLRLSSAVSSLCCPHPKRSPCGPQARLCQLKPHMELCQEGLVGVLPAAGASLQRPRPLKAPQTQGWQVHNSLYCGEGGSPERQLLGDSHLRSSSLDTRVRPGARDLCCETRLLFSVGRESPCLRIAQGTHPLRL